MRSTLFFAAAALFGGAMANREHQDDPDCTDSSKPWSQPQSTPSWTSTQPTWTSSTPVWTSSTPTWTSSTPTWTSSTPTWTSSTPTWTSTSSSKEHKTKTTWTSSESTVYSTSTDTIYSCGPEVTSCPYRSHSSTAAGSTSSVWVSPSPMSSAMPPPPPPPMSSGSPPPPPPMNTCPAPATVTVTVTACPTGGSAPSSAPGTVMTSSVAPYPTGNPTWTPVGTAPMGSGTGVPYTTGTPFTGDAAVTRGSMAVAVVGAIMAAFF